MKNRFLPGLSALIVLGALAQAQVLSASAPKGQENVQLQLDGWRAQHGANWEMKFDAGYGYARFLYGGNAAPAFTPRHDADFLALARQVARDTYGMHGIEVATLVDDEVVFLPLSFAGSSDKMTVQFRQFVHGVPVEQGFFNVLFDREGRTLSVDTTAVPNVAGMLTTAAISGERALDTALQLFQADTGMVATDVVLPELLIFKDQSGELPRAVLAWKVTTQFLASDFEAEGFTYYIDANNGRMVERYDAIHNFDVSGNIKTMATPGTLPDTAGNPATSQNMVRVTVNSPAGNVLTDSNGDFNIVGAAAPLNITVTYKGQFATVTNNGGQPASFPFTLNAASGNASVMNSPASSFITSQANAFVWINLMRDWTRAVNPTDNKSDFLAIANVNLNQTCNAFYNGGSVNFFTAGGGCVNTSYSSVILHEMGHWLNDRYGSGNGGDGFGEGNADNFATYITDQPIVGQNFCGNGCHIRSGLNNRQFCGDNNGGCHGGVHADGEVLMGACWKVRTNLKNTLGNGPGIAAADTLFNSWMNAYNDTQIKTIVEVHWLTLDDNDGNLQNGTPNFVAIEGGFRQQGFPQINLPAVIFSNVTVLPDTLNTGGPYVVNADVVANTSPPVTSVLLKFRLNGGGFSTVSMNPVSGNTYTGNIFGQPCPTYIEYYVQGSNSAGQSAVFPATAPGSGMLDFNVANVTAAFHDNFETNQLWAASSAGATAGFWQRGVPVNDPNWDYDPDADGDGSGNAYLTQNTLGNSDVDGGSVTLTSPIVDMSAPSFTLSYLYYLNLSVADGSDRLLVEANNNNGVGAWTTLATHTTNGNLLWRSGSFTRPQLLGLGFVPTATSKLRFTANDGGAQSIVEAGVDGVKVETISCQGACPTPVIYCSPKVNSMGCIPDIQSLGTASATAPNGFLVFANEVRNNKSGIMFYGINGRASIPFQGGTLCVSTPIKRTPALNSNGAPPPANDCSGSYQIDMNAFARGSLGGLPLAELSVVGTVVQAQFWGRDPGFPQPNNTTLTGGLEYTVCP